MNERDTLLLKVGELIRFLNANGHSPWAERLQQVISKPEATTLMAIRKEVRGLYGAMGSLTDIDIYFEGDAPRTRLANRQLNVLLDDLFELARKNRVTGN